MDQLQLLHNSDIDLQKWDKCIDESTNGRVYAQSWYLDIVCPDWKGVICGDYDYVMPVCAAHKFGISYIYQPTYCQQHGIFPPTTPTTTNDFIELIKSKYRYFNLAVNSMNIIKDNQLQIGERRNQILSLKNKAEKIREGYSAHAKRYVKKGNKQCHISSIVNMDEYLSLKSKHPNSVFTKKHYQNLKLIIHKSLNRNTGLIYGAYSEKNELIAAAFFLIEKRRKTYLNSVSSPEGKKQRAMYAIVNKFIEEHAECPCLLDFEGSNNDGISRFFAGFGAQQETYLNIQYNNLPWPLKLLKK